MFDNSTCFKCVHAAQALRYYYEHQAEEIQFTETDGEQASVIVDMMLATITRYLILKSGMGINDIELAFHDTLSAFEEERGT